MIEIIPAIDIIGGRCTRLSQGDYATQKDYGGDPAEWARAYADCGVRRLHLVDLEGAKASAPRNLRTLEKIASLGLLTLEWGGGIKTDDDIEKAFAAGAQMVTVGSIAVTCPELFGQWLEKYGAERIILGADVRNGKISINGWKEDSAEDLLPFLEKYIKLGVKNVLCTEISKDGTLEGPATELYKQVMAAYPALHLIASGGVSSNQDIRQLEEAGIPAVVFGKAFYEGRINISELWV